MGTSGLINLDVEDIIKLGLKYNLNIKSLDDMPALVQAMNDWGQFGSAVAYQAAYTRFLEHKRKEMHAETTT